MFSRTATYFCGDVKLGKMVEHGLSFRQFQALKVCLLVELGVLSICLVIK